MLKTYVFLILLDFEANQRLWNKKSTFTVIKDLPWKMDLYKEFNYKYAICEKQTYVQLSFKYGYYVKTIQRKTEKHLVILNR